MYSKKQFTALEAMCREQAALARSEMKYSLMKYRLAHLHTNCPGFEIGPPKRRPEFANDGTEVGHSQTMFEH